MGWAWKLIGVGAGAALGGPIGAVIGAVVGHILDSAGEDTLTESEAAAACVGSFLARLAYETGNFDQREKELIADICLEVAESSRMTREAVLEVLTEWARNDELFGRVLDMARNEAGLRGFLLYSAWRVASRDNEVDPAERLWIQKAALAMGDTEGLAEMLGRLFTRTDDSDNSERRQAYDVLGLPPSASLEQIRTRYRELSKKYHPDRYPTAEPALRELAIEKLAQINHAYEILSSRGPARLFGLSPEGDSLIEPMPRSVVRCFFCGQKCRLPTDQAHLSQARCPKCQVLLLFEQGLAMECLEAFREQRG